MLNFFQAKKIDSVKAVYLSKHNRVLVIAPHDATNGVQDVGR